MALETKARREASGAKGGGVRQDGKGQQSSQRFAPKSRQGGRAIGGGFVWVTNTDDDSVSRIDPLTQSVTRIPVGRSPRGVAYGAGAVWVADGGDGTVKRIDGSTPSPRNIETLPDR